eukprot:TRINITY_DN29545_c0_g1_i1.p1 TRINITY_DN29545_c0_g1~~TRINITY_DN29545_c0_g1_i1.p1  ORF type:complete len:327 (-),score=110.24 TRINITY_DN29545_c0_g1_i1:286-1212(-)
MPVDYSKFDAIVDSDDETGKENKTPAAVSKTAVVEKPTCRNCGKDAPKVACGKCKTAKYCDAQCQRTDWQFHKRICKAPEDKKKEDEARKKQEAKEEKKQQAPASKPKANDVEVEDEKIEGWYRHRETRLPADTNSAPKKVEASPEASPSASPASSAGQAGSAWNKAGTWEERDVLPAAKTVLETQLLPLKEVDFGRGIIRGKEVKSIEGSASAVVVRGTPRLLFDLTFTIVFEVCVAGGQPLEANVVVKDWTGSSEEPALELPSLGSLPPDIREAVRGKMADKSNGGLTQQILAKLREVVGPAVVAL